MRVHSVRDLAAAVRGRRTDLGMSQAKLATQAGVSRKWVYEFEAGKPTAELRPLLRVVETLGLALRVDLDERTRAPEGTVIDLDALIDEHRAP